ncbi:MAG: hypothetical protein WBE90_09745 [Xanthobacteraceae bacterium]
MATKSSFTADEWKTILGSPVLAGMAVTLAEPSGLWGLMKEGMASGRAVMDAKNDAGATELAKAIATEMEGSEGRGDARGGLRAELTGKTPAELKQHAALTRVGQIVDAKTPDEAPAQIVAHACRRESGRGFDRRRLHGDWRGSGKRC